MSFDTKTGCPNEINDSSQRLDISTHTHIYIYIYIYILGTLKPLLQ